MEMNLIRNDAPVYQTTTPWRNSPLPSISHLPTELLAVIFQLSLTEIDFKSRYASPSLREHVKELYIMRSVTKRWQAIIEGTPSFWTTIAFELPSHVNEASILCSSNLPLFIFCYNPVFRLDRRSETEFLKLIQPVRARWSVLTLDLYDQTALSDYLGSPSPLLQTIIVRSLYHTSLDPVEPVELLGGDTSNLRCVELSRVSVRWRMGCFVQLKCLKLKDVHNGQTTKNILDAIYASPGLQVLKLTGITGTDIPQSSPTITLQHLNYIKLHDCSNRLVDFILRGIQAPSCTRLSLSIIGLDEQFDAPHFLNDTLKSFHPILRKIHRLHRRSEVVLDSRGIEWHTLSDFDMGGFSIDIDSFFDPLFTDWVDRILEDETGLNICFGYGGTSNEAVLRSVAPMRRVTGVAMQEGWRQVNASPVLRFLGEPLATSPSLPSLPCLQELRLPSEGWKTRDLLEMVQSRFCTVGWEAMERTPLTIHVQRRRVVLRKGGTWRILDFAAVVNIRNTSGVECFNLAGWKNPEDKLAVVWNEEASKVVWG
ncbi:hypothetical protein FS837_004126 [Tulasnella sp. UAMH 9824]|nr:hypothetical protein FS837_004126 [Tulasnella sp. UAMH 9824]